ncbi:VRR-NUC domain-containing protein [Zhengella sp. ZM62]|uniref:VRR-NUC domain-containing protein n=1 Tax=Zhengella sedimenti TaxID=3390035 RepID=UPI0039771FCB
MTERALHKAVIDYLRVALPSTCRAFTNANDGARGQPGLTRGIPDISIIREGGSIAFIELKTAKGRLSDHQTNFLDWCAERAVPAAVCRSVEDVRDQCQEWGIPLKGVRL